MKTESSAKISDSMRPFWIVFGLATQLLFLLTALSLFAFLWGPNLSNRFHHALAMGFVSRVIVDPLLLIQFALSHSLLLHPKTRKALQHWIPGPQYGCFFCMVTCISLIVLIGTWQGQRAVVWHLHGPYRIIMHGAYLMSWAALFYSINLTGLGYQTGWTPWWAWVRGRKPPHRTFEIKGAYRYFRHPIYLSFLGLIWFCPAVTRDRFLLDVVWTIYIGIGSWFKDNRLEYYIGSSYRDYRRRVSAVPFPSGIIQRLRRKICHNPDRSGMDVAKAGTGRA